VFQTKERLTETQQGNKSIHLKTWDPPVTDLHFDQKRWRPQRPSKYRRAISLPTLETSLSFTAERKTMQSPVLAANWGLEIRMQLVEITWAPQTDYIE
jgi:hypothetical protein